MTPQLAAAARYASSRWSHVPATRRLLDRAFEAELRDPAPERVSEHAEHRLYVTGCIACVRRRYGW